MVREGMWVDCSVHTSVLHLISRGGFTSHFLELSLQVLCLLQIAVHEYSACQLGNYTCLWSAQITTPVFTAEKKFSHPLASPYLFRVLSLFHCVEPSVTPWTVTARLLSPWDSPGKNTGVGCHALLQGFLLTQRCEPGSPVSHLLHLLYPCLKCYSLIDTSFTLGGRTAGFVYILPAVLLLLI